MDITEINLLDEVYYLKICMKLNASDWYELQNSTEWKAVTEFVNQCEIKDTLTEKEEKFAEIYHIPEENMLFYKTIFNKERKYKIIIAILICLLVLIGIIAITWISRRCI